jgi:hypothetical protein
MTTINISEQINNVITEQDIYFGVTGNTSGSSTTYSYIDPSNGSEISVPSIEYEFTIGGTSTTDRYDRK